MKTLNLEQNKYHGNICTVERLKRYIKISSEEEKEIRKAIKIHPLLISKYYLSLIDKKDKNDPIKKMIIPSAEEMNIEGVYDTSGEHQNTKMTGLQHKYRQTALILATNRCPAYCRFCFRKRLIGLSEKEIIHRFSQAVSYIKSHKEINNVLISGGDPLILPTRIIRNFLQKLSSIKHLDFIRIGTRTIVTFPMRILYGQKLVKLLEYYNRTKKRIYIVTHFNHPNEITNESTEAVKMLTQAGLVVNNQTVFMTGVNDKPKVLAELMRGQVRIGVNPYYVFQCRPVRRVKHHFQVPIYKGIKIIEQAKAYLDGHSKRFKYTMSHRTGKIEIVGTIGKHIYFKYHQAKELKNMGKFFRKRINKKAGWLDDFK